MDANQELAKLLRHPSGKLWQKPLPIEDAAALSAMLALYNTGKLDEPGDPRKALSRLARIAYWLGHYAGRTIRGGPLIEEGNGHE